jgi:hypothetical protein
VAATVGVGIGVAVAEGVQATPIRARRAIQQIKNRRFLRFFMLLHTPDRRAKNCARPSSCKVCSQ